MASFYWNRANYFRVPLTATVTKWLFYEDCTSNNRLVQSKSNLSNSPKTCTCSIIIFQPRKSMASIYCTLTKEGPLWNIGPPPLLIRSKVYLNMHPYVLATPEHTCMITIKWAWLRSLENHQPIPYSRDNLRNKLNCTVHNTHEMLKIANPWKLNSLKISRYMISRAYQAAKTLDDIMG